jgi:branched-chain amino acid aminotransferase
VPKAQAKISVYDHGFLYGDGVFETLRAYAGKIFLLNEHIKRLCDSAQAIHLTIPLTDRQLKQLLHESLLQNNLQAARIRLTISRGYGELGLDATLCPKPTVVIMAHNFEGYPDKLYQQGLTASIVNIRRISPNALNPAIKSLNFLNNILAKQAASNQGAKEAIMLNARGQLTEATTSNLFWISQDILRTPALECGILPGITRRLVLKLARRNKIKLEEGKFCPAELFNATEAFLTNTGFEVMPLVQVDNKPIGRGTPGTITRRLHKLFRAEVQKLTLQEAVFQPCGQPQE